MTQSQLRFVSAAILLCLSKVTLAAGLTSYVGVGVGNTSAVVSSPSGQVSESGAGYRLVAGSQIGQYFSVETEYVDLGEFTDTSSKVAVKGLGISAVLLMPVMEIMSVYGRAGLARMETTVMPLAGFVPATPLTDTVVGLSLGYGIQVDVAPNASIRISWDRYKSSALAGPFTDRINMNSSALLIFRF